ncbi:hypothetical protein BaRGS_00040325 [Batillaria attramentaria]|uniref:Uncharacterized protein n=1 Tax=Batillaria attramentaria TaxID=370345 RepID=A0ABD0J0J4_9CAEN
MEQKGLEERLVRNCLNLNTLKDFESEYDTGVIIISTADGTVGVDDVFNNDMSDVTSEEFHNYEYKFCYNMRESLREMIDVTNCTVRSLRNGSVIVSFELEFVAEKNETAETLQSLLASKTNGSHVQIGNLNIFKDRVNLSVHNSSQEIGDRIHEHKPVPSEFDCSQTDKDFLPLPYTWPDFCGEYQLCRLNERPQFLSCAEGQEFFDISNLLLWQKTARNADYSTAVCHASADPCPTNEELESSYNCPQNGTHYLPRPDTYPDHCDVYTKCFEGTAFNASCASGHHYHNDRKPPCTSALSPDTFCARRKICYRQRQEMQTTQSPSRPVTLHQTSTDPCPTNEDLERSYTCPQNGTHYLPRPDTYPDHCDVYTKCFEGTAFNASCASGHHYHNDRKPPCTSALSPDTFCARRKICDRQRQEMQTTQSPSRPVTLHQTSTDPCPTNEDLERSYTCPQNGIHYLPRPDTYPDHCDVYTKCFEGTAFNASCASGHHYHNDRKPPCTSALSPDTFCARRKICYRQRQEMQTTQSPSKPVTLHQTSTDPCPTNEDLERSYTCPQNGTHYLPRPDTYPDHCDVYTKCFEGTAFNASCASGHHYHNDRKPPCTSALSPDTFCARRKICDRQRQEMQTTQSPSRPVTLHQTSTDPCPTNEDVERSYTCPQNGIHYLPRPDTYPDHCDVYTKCFEGTAFNASCASGHHYHNDRKPPCTSALSPDTFCARRKICYRQRQEMQTTQSPSKPVTLHQTSTDPCPTNEDLERSYTCPQNGTHYLPRPDTYPDHCDVYTKCFEGTAFNESCASGHHYHNDRKPPCTSALSPDTFCARRKICDRQRQEMQSTQSPSRSVTLHQTSTDPCPANVDLERSFTCPPAGIHYLPRPETYPDRCEVYTWCLHGTANVKSCARGHHYRNDRKPPCTSASSPDTFCSRMKSCDRQRQEIQTTKSPSATPDHTSPNLCAKNQELESSHTCPPTGYLYIPRLDTYPDHCDAFIWCINGIAVEGFCALGTHFWNKIYPCRDAFSPDTFCERMKRWETCRLKG